jgi:hypothetical protein
MGLFVCIPGIGSVFKFDLLTLSPVIIRLEPRSIHLLLPLLICLLHVLGIQSARSS